MPKSPFTLRGGDEGQAKEFVYFAASLRQELELPFGKQVVYTNGIGGWIMSPQGMMAMTPAALKQSQGEMFRLLFHLAVCEVAP